MARKIKVLYTTPNFETAGSGKVIYDLVNGIDKSKFAPEILVKKTDGKFFKEIEKLGVPIHVFNYEAKYKPLITFPFRVLAIARYLKKLNVDMIHSWNWSSDVSEPLAARLAGIKFIYTKKAMGWGNKSWIWKSKLSHRVIAINKAMMKEFFDGLSGVKATYLPLGLDTEVYQPQSYHQPTADKHFIQPTDFVVISVVNMTKVKGIEDLIEAVIQSDIPHIKLLLVGYDKEEYAIEIKAKYEHQYPQIIFTGKQLEVRHYLSVADVFVIPTKNKGKREGMPMAPVEAMSSGVPVIGSNVSGIQDILEGFDEYLFKAGDVNSLKEKLLEFKGFSKKERQNIGVQMRNKVIDQYNFKKFIDSREKLYLNCTNE